MGTSRKYTCGDDNRVTIQTFNEKECGGTATDANESDVGTCGSDHKTKFIKCGQASDCKLDDSLYSDEQVDAAIANAWMNRFWECKERHMVKVLTIQNYLAGSEQDKCGGDFYTQFWPVDDCFPFQGVRIVADSHVPDTWLQVRKQYACGSDNKVTVGLFTDDLCTNVYEPDGVAEPVTALELPDIGGVCSEINYQQKVVSCGEQLCTVMPESLNASWKTKHNQCVDPPTTTTVSTTFTTTTAAGISIDSAIHPASISGFASFLAMCICVTIH